jgi:hypothetical protein
MCFRFPFSEALENRKKQAAVFVIGRNRLNCCSVGLKPLLASRVSTAGRKSVLLCRDVSSGSDILLTGIFVGSDRKAEIFFFFGYGRPSKVCDGIAYQRQMCGSSRRRHTDTQKGAPGATQPAKSVASFPLSDRRVNTLGSGISLM